MKSFLFLFTVAISTQFLLLACNSADEAQATSSSPTPVVRKLASVDTGHGIRFGFMHTKQNCAVNENGVLRKPTYCLPSDREAMNKLSGMVDNINAQLDTALSNVKKAQVSIAYFSFSNSGVQKKVCELSSQGVSIRIFLDRGSAGTIDRGIMENSDCRDKNGTLNVKLSYLGGHTNGGSGGIWRLHHNKFLMIDLGNGEPVKLNFSSGNLSSYGTSLHLDHWVTMEAPADSNIVNAHRCIMKGLEAAVEASGTVSGLSAAKADRTVSQAYINTREQCFDAKQVLPRVNGGATLAQIETILHREQIAPLFSPNNDNYVAEAFIHSIQKLESGSYLYIAIQHFLHNGVASALINASNRGVDVRIIMEDGALKRESEVPGVDKMIQNLLTKAPRMQIRFAETNHNNGDRPAMMHNKLALLNGKMTFSGAGHYTNAAMRNNWENFYFVTNSGVIASYTKYFKSLWDQSVDAEYTKSYGQTATSQPPKLAKDFLKLIEN